MIFPLNLTEPGTKNCCEKGVDCFDFLYEVGTNFKICGDKCTTCEDNANNCLTCYNNNELNKYSNYKSDIQAFKSNPNTDYFWDYGKTQCIDVCTNCWFDADEDMFVPCYQSCLTCQGKGNSTNHNCTSCDETYNYFHIDSASSENCIHTSLKPSNYYLNTENYISG